MELKVCSIFFAVVLLVLCAKQTESLSEKEKNYDSSSSNGPKIVTLNGIVQGKWQISRQTRFHRARNFSSFEGIPYAKPPGRFQSPEPPESWTGIRDASFVRSVCPQFDGDVFYDETEDCLFANVYVPQLEKPRPLPVMFWIHGGGFQLDAGSTYGPKYIMEQDVILVTINYRLGVLGFLNTGDDFAQGNMGVKDMIMGLKWVQANIRAFGGDPASVTIFGQSAGGVAVHALTLSSAAEGLFHKAISQSGTILPNWSFNDEPEILAARFKYELNCSNDYDDEEADLADDFKDCVKNKSITEILEAQQRTGEIFVLSIDRNASDFSVLPDTPIQMLRNPGSKRSSRVPFLLGWNLKEALMAARGILQNPRKVKMLNENWFNYIPKLLGLYKIADAENLDKICSDIRNFYFRGIPEISIKNLDNFTNLITDNFVHGIKQTAILQATYNDYVYPYVFTYNGIRKNESERSVGEEDFAEGPAHFDEVCYLFSPLEDFRKQFKRQELDKGSIDEEFSTNLVDLWTSFASKGKPVSWGEEWIPFVSKEFTNSSFVSKTALNWYNLDVNAKLVQESEDLNERLAFWDSVFAS